MMDLRKLFGDMLDPGPWLSVTIENGRSGKSITLFHHQAKPAEVEHTLREVIQGTTGENETPIKITISEAKWLSDHLRSHDQSH